MDPQHRQVLEGRGVAQGAGIDRIEACSFRRRRQRLLRLGVAAGVKELRGGTGEVGVFVVLGAEGAGMERVGAARGCVVPETPEQRRWITDFAKSLVTGIPK